MAENRRPGKLAVILHADIAGSTTLIQHDEHIAHERIRDTFQRLSGSIEKYQGHVCELRGDALLAEFQRASDAVTAVLAFQLEQTQYISQLNDNIRPAVRVGISLGEVIIADNTVTGAGVVLAQRIEQLAEPGGLCVTGAIHEALPQRLPFVQDNLGDQHVKGFDELIKVYAVSLRPGNSIPGPEALPQKDAVALALPDKPSIAVLPFTNMSGEVEQEYFSDGISEDIITALSKISSLMVVARSSTFTYKGKSVDIRQVGREQGVRYVLEGSVRKAANRVRVTAQLIDATSGHHIWADSYDRELDDIFAVQDELMREIVVALDVELREGEQVRMWSSGTRNVKAWELVRLSTPIILGGVEEKLKKAEEWLERALELDPEYAIAWVMLGWLHQNFVDISTGMRDPTERQTALTSMRECVQKAIEIDDCCADAYSVMAMYHMELREFDAAIENAEKSIVLAPSNAENLCEASAVMNKCGEPGRALELARRAMRLCPMYRAGFLRALAFAYRSTGDPELAADTLKQAVKRQPDLLSGRVNLTSVLGELGRLEEAKDQARHVLRLAPDFSITEYARGLSYRNPQDLQRVVQGLRLAGLHD